MKHSFKSREYAKALFLLDSNPKNRKLILDDLLKISEIMTALPEFRDFLKVQTISIEEKLSFIKRFFKLQSLTISFLTLVFKKRISYLLPAIANDFKKLVDMAEGIQKINIVTAVSLSKEQKDIIKNRIDNIYNFKSDISFMVDENIIAGMIVHFRDIYLDGSIKTHLRNIKELIASGSI